MGALPQWQKRRYNTKVVTRWATCGWACCLLLSVGCSSEETGNGGAGAHTGAGTSSTNSSVAAGGGTTTSASGGTVSGGGGSTDGGIVSLPSCDPLAALDASTMPSTAASSNAYQSPQATRATALRQAIAALDAGDAGGALKAAGEASYQVCSGSGVQADLALLRPDANDGQAWVVLRSNATRAIIIGAPHAFHEAKTLAEAKVIFEQLAARAIVVTSTHRCASDSASACDGTTAVCSASAQPFRISDMAHVDDSLFHAAHRELLTLHPNDSVLSLHGMLRDGVSVSNGSSAAAGATTPGALLTKALAAAFPAALVTTCNDYGGGDHAVHLCGTTNAQGRLVNGSSNACTMSAMANGRFVHLEQSKAIRADPTKVATALGSALP